MLKWGRLKCDAKIAIGGRNVKCWNDNRLDYIGHLPLKCGINWMWPIELTRSKKFDNKTVHEWLNADRQNLNSSDHIDYLPLQNKRKKLDVA